MKIVLIEIKFAGHDIANLNVMQASYTRYELTGKKLEKGQRVDRIYNFDEGKLDIGYTKKETIRDWLKTLESTSDTNTQHLFWSMMESFAEELGTLFILEDDFALEVLQPFYNQHDSVHQEKPREATTIDDEYGISLQLMKETSDAHITSDIYLEFKKQFDSMKNYMKGKSKKVRVGVKKLKDGLSLPFRATKRSSGADIAICEKVIIWPGKSELIHTGLSFNIPEGYEIQLRPRSSSMAKLRCMIHFGTIDQDYTGEVKIMVTNMSLEHVILAAGTSLGQLVVQKIPDVEYYEIEELQKTERGEGGFGSTGLIHDNNPKEADHVI